MTLFETSSPKTEPSRDLVVQAKRILRERLAVIGRQTRINCNGVTLLMCAFDLVL